jgi:hypothetical protein
MQPRLIDRVWPATSNATTKLLVIVSRLLIPLPVILWRYLFVSFHP